MAESVYAPGVQLAGSVMTGSLSIPAGTGTGLVKPSGVLYSAVFVGAGNGISSSTSENAVGTATYTMPANTLSADGMGVRIKFLGNTAATADTKTTKCYFGATAVTGRAATADNGTVYASEATIWRTGAATQVGVGTFWVGGVQAGNVTTLVTPGETLSGAVVIRMMGNLSTVGTANQVMSKAFTVELLTP